MIMTDLDDPNRLKDQMDILLMENQIKVSGKRMDLV